MGHRRLDINDLGLSSITNLVAEGAGNLDINSIIGNPNLPQPAKDILTKLTQSDGINFQFPILDNPAAAVFNLLLGKDSDLASFSADFHLASAPDYGGGVSVFGVNVGFGGSVSIDAHFRFAYDTFGLRELIRDIGSGVGNLASDVTDGFYIDTSSHLSIGASVGVHAGATVLVFSASIGGGVSTGDASGTGIDHPAVVSFVDPNGNGYGHGTGSGKLRFADFSPCRVMTVGELDASLTIELKVGVTILGTFIGYSVDDDLASVKLLDLNYSCGNVPSPPPQPVLASEADANGDVTLFIGSQLAYRRYLPDATPEHHSIPGTNNPSDEDYTISHVSGDRALGRDDSGLGVRADPDHRGCEADLLQRRRPGRSDD